MLPWIGLALLVLLVVAILVLRKESRWIERGLVEEVRQGALTEAEFLLLRSARERLRVRWQMRLRGGRAASRAVGRYFQCATELAFKKQHLRSLGDEGGNLAEIQRLRSEFGRSAEPGPSLAGPGRRLSAVAAASASLTPPCLTFTVDSATMLV